MSTRERDWIFQAERDLKHLKNSLNLGEYEWACFAAQQAAEKALKALYEKLNMRTSGHSMIALFKGLEKNFKIPEEFFYYARILSRYYIEARDPNGFPSGAPFEYFDEKIAR